VTLVRAIVHLVRHPISTLALAGNALARGFTVIGEEVEAELTRGQEITNRDQLLVKSARTAADACSYFRQGEPGDGDCDSDGHYLCDECSRMSHQEAVRRGIVRCKDCEEAADG
jgi:hypothetical protein